VIIYGDSDQELKWFKSLNSSFANLKTEIIKSRGLNPKLIESIIKYDRPDIILVKDDKPLLVLEISRETPTGHNVGQRMARLIRALELEIPTIYFFPFDAKKHGVHASIVNLNARLLKMFDNATRIHDTPIIAVNWLADDNGELIDDPSIRDFEIKNIIKKFIENDFSKNSPIFAEILKNNKNEYNTRTKNFPNYLEPPNSLEIIETNKLYDLYSFLDEINDSLLSKQESAIYKIGYKNTTKRRQDPYTGTQFIYDYLYCRSGNRVQDKFRNLILSVQNFSKEEWLRKNPNDNTKSSNWYLTANAIICNDGLINVIE